MMVVVFTVCSVSQRVKLMVESDMLLQKEIAGIMKMRAKVNSGTNLPA